MVVKDVRAFAAIELADKGHQRSQACISAEAFEHGRPGNVVVSTNTVNTDYRVARIQFARNRQSACECLGPSSCGERVLERAAHIHKRI